MKRFGVIFILFLILTGLIRTHTAYAVDPSSDRKTFIDAVDKCVTGDCTNKQWYWTDSLNTSQQFMIGSIVGGSDLSYSPFYNGKSALVYMGSAITAMYANPPADLALWLQDTGQSLGFVPRQVHAQGIGFTGFSALLPLWKAFRNIAYALLAIIMVVIGFMVMFRRKIDPKTVVTVQNALPKIVITLILITFSYAIVALMIDLMYLVIFLMVGLFNSTGLMPASPNPLVQAAGYKTMTDVMSRGGLFAVFSTIFPPGFTLTKLSADLIGYNIGWVASGLGLGAGLGFLTGNPVVGVATAGVVVGAPLIVQFLLSLALLFTFIRLIILFVGSYVQIVLALIIGPIQIMSEAIPGTNAFNSWMKNLFANIVIFPIGAGMFLLSIAFITATDKFSGAVWAPPFATLPGANVKSISALFALGVLMVIPSIAQGIKEAIKTKPLIPAGPGTLFSPIGGAIQTSLGTASQFYYGSQMVGTIGGWFDPTKRKQKA